MTLKAQTCMNWMAHGEIFVHFDSTRRDVRVPDWFRSTHSVLPFGFELAVPICDLCVNQQGISGTLTFDRMPMHCDIPWAAVYKVRSDVLDAVRLWIEDAPENLRAQLSQAMDKRDQEEKLRALKSSLRCIKGGAS